MRYSRIIGTGGYLPSKVLTNDELEKMVETTVVVLGSKIACDINKRNETQDKGKLHIESKRTFEVPSQGHALVQGIHSAETMGVGGWIGFAFITCKSTKRDTQP